jgi:hypothetical protein
LKFQLGEREPSEKFIGKMDEFDNSVNNTTQQK